MTDLDLAIIVIAAVGGIALLVWVFVVRAERKRRAALEQLALLRGWAFTAKVDLAALPDVAAFQLS